MRYTVRRSYVAVIGKIWMPAMVINMNRESASNRVQNSSTLRPYYDLLIDYEWEDMEAHLKWVAAADEIEILHWAEKIREDEESEEVENA